MTKILVSLVAVGFALASSGGTPVWAGGSSSAGDAAGYAAVGPSNAFGYALTGQVARGILASDANQNILISPASAAMALQMLLNGAGAGSSTYTEMVNALQLGSLQASDVNQSNESLLSYFTELSHAPVPVEPQGPVPVPFTLTIANSAWSNSQGGFRFNPAFLSTLTQSYAATAKSVDFETTGAGEINQWASDNTAGKVPQVIDQKTLAGLSFVLMNATYFKANWQVPFEAQNTQSALFTHGDGTKANVDTMQSLVWGYAEVAGNQVVELPYDGGSTSMFVVLPAAGRSMIDVLADNAGPLTEDFWNQVGAADEGKVELSLPKFSFNNNLNLTQSLEALGMKTLFTPAADLSAAGNGQVSVSAVNQNTFIQVDEHGTEAAAVTTIMAGASGMPALPIPTMTVDRPFLISIVEKKSGSVLFLGTVSKP